MVATLPRPDEHFLFSVHADETDATSGMPFSQTSQEGSRGATEVVTEAAGLEKEIGQFQDQLVPFLVEGHRSGDVLVKMGTDFATERPAGVRGGQTIANACSGDAAVPRRRQVRDQNGTW